MIRTTTLLVAIAAVAARSTSALGLELHWEAPEGCPTAGEIEAEVSRIVGTSPGADRQVVVDVKVHGGRPWTVLLHTRSGGDEGERMLEGASCQEVASAAVLVIALTIDPNAAPAPPPPTPAPPPAPQPPPIPPAPAARPVRVVLQTSAGVALETLPGIAPFVSVAAGVLVGRVAVYAGASFVPETSQTVAALPGAGGRFWLLGLDVIACAEPVASGRFELWGCAGIELQRMAGSGFGVTDPKNAYEVWAAPRIDAVPALAVAPRIRLLLPVGVSAPLERPTFALGGVGPVFGPPPVGLRVGLGGEVHF